LNEDSKATFDDFVSDANIADQFSAKGLSSRLSLLISGPPGTGKTLLAGHVASRLGRSLYTVRLDSVISSLLGDTAKNIRNLFEYVPSKDGVLFLDEIDAIAKLRDDKHELGELKRVVNTVIQGLDALDDRAIVVAATNHAHMLDPAIFRRFPYRIELGLPETSVREALWREFLFQGDSESSLPQLLARISGQLSGALIQEISLAARRQAARVGQALDVGSVAWAIQQTKEGRLVLPSRAGLTTEQKRQLATQFVRNGVVSAADVARLFGISRQAISAYLRDD
jgi:SpoVK/Ycf46/Vps4 family AAA+-type ATPase